MIARAAALALLLGLAAPAAAAGAAPAEREPGPYHGGALPETGPVLAYLNVAEDGRRFEALITLRAECEDFAVPVQARISVPDARLDADGEATVTRRIEGSASGPDGRPAREEGESTVTVRVGRDGRASGTVRLASTFFDAEDESEVASCDTGTVAFRARQVRGVPRGRARVPREATDLVGVAGVQPLVARTTAEGDLDGIAFVYRSSCQPRSDGRGARRIIFLPEFRVKSDGTFRVRASQQLLLPDGEEAVRIDLRGRFGPRGTVRARLRLRGVLEREGDEAPGKSCDTGSMRVRMLPVTSSRPDET